MIGDRIVLASASPRRRELATQLGVRFDVVPADIDESPLADETATAYVERLAREKASAAAGLCGGTAQSDPGIPPRLVLAADTTVELDGAIFGKPADAADAARMLRLLSGRVHHVHTGVAVAVAVRPVAVRPVGDPPVRELRHDVHSLVVTTEVVLDDLAESDVAFYVATGEPLDKAGAYAIQGLGGAYVTAVRGSVSNVIGLPLVETRRLLREVGHRLGGR